MSVRTFSTEQVIALNANPYVRQATDKRITYTDEFKSLFVRRYKEGFTPRRIFLDAGFDVDALGHKRIERASDRWRQMNDQGKLIDTIEGVTVHERGFRDLSPRERELAAQAEMIVRLIDENTRLRREIEALEALA